MVTNTRLLPVLLSVCLLVETFAQTSQIVPWNDSNLSEQSIAVNAYHPEPVIFVHGIAASRVRWEDVIAYLHSNEWFTPYHYREDLFIAAKESTAAPQEDYTAQELAGNFPATEKNQWRDIEQPYLHTFNYGRHAKRLPDRSTRPWTRVRPNRQTHDPLEWNAWAAPANDYLQGRTTLRDHIENPTDGIREAYRMPGQDPPSVLLISHSLGGMVVAEYLMTKQAHLGADPYVPVRRSVAINSFFWGSPLANVLANFDDNWFNPYTDVLLENMVKAIGGVASSPFAVWVENRNGVNWQAITVDLEDAVAKSNIPPIQTKYFLSRGGPFRERIRSTPFPVTTEFVTSGSRLAGPDLLQSSARVLLGRNTAYHDIKTVFEGDGMLPFNTMAGYNSNGTPAFVNLAPVDIRGYLVDTNACPSATNWFASHSEAPGKVGIYPHLLAGIQYLTGPRPERPGNWSGLQKQYTNSPVQTVAGVTFVHTDEPGIAQVVLLQRRLAGQNPFVILATNTWSLVAGIPQRVVSNATGLVGCQVAGAEEHPIRVAGTTGVKNRSANPVGTEGANYWVRDGNEYLPASLQLQVVAGITTQLVATTTNTLAAATRLVTNCLVQVDGTGAVEFQYGYFESDAGPVVAGTNNFVAVQGYNLAGLLTPQAERAFDVPVASSNLVAILRRINQAEAFSNACHAATEPTRWTQTIREWLTLTTNTIAYPLNFVPGYVHLWGPPLLSDPWTGAALTNGWAYDATNNAIIVTDHELLSTHVLATYEAFLGTATGFTNISGGATNFVPALTDNALAGVPVDEAFLGTVRDRLANVVGKYRDLTSTNGAAWTPATILTAAGSTNGTWSPITGGLLTPHHFTELANVTALLTDPHEYCPCTPCGTNLPATVTVTVALVCEGEPVDPLCGPLFANPNYGNCTANDKAWVAFTANAPLARANVNGNCGWVGDIGHDDAEDGGGCSDWRVGNPVGGLVEWEQLAVSVEGAGGDPVWRRGRAVGANLRPWRRRDAGGVWLWCQRCRGAGSNRRGGGQRGHGLRFHCHGSSHRPVRSGCVRLLRRGLLSKQPMLAGRRFRFTFSVSAITQCGPTP